MTATPPSATLTGTSATLASIAPWSHALLRIGAGLLYTEHGLQKLFGWFGGMGGTPGATVHLASQMTGGSTGNLRGAAAGARSAHAPGGVPPGRRDARSLLPGSPASRWGAAAERRRTPPALYAGLPVLRHPRRRPGQPRRPQPAALTRHGRRLNAACRNPSTRVGAPPPSAPESRPRRRARPSVRPAACPAGGAPRPPGHPRARLRGS
jgi:hypothetical protein